MSHQNYLIQINRDQFIFLPENGEFFDVHRKSYQVERSNVDGRQSFPDPFCPQKSQKSFINMYDLILAHNDFEQMVGKHAYQGVKRLSNSPKLTIMVVKFSSKPSGCKDVLHRKCQPRACGKHLMFKSFNPIYDEISHLGSLSEKKTGLCGKNSQAADPPHPPPQFGNFHIFLPFL